MRVKKFEARSMKDALQMVKKELGPDAVILAARDNSRGFGIKGEASVEVTAAVSESTLQKKKFVESRMTATARERFQQSDARTQRKIINQMVEKRLQGIEEPPRRSITRTSYIDIQDDEAELGPRRSAYERAMGRNVADLLDDFDQDLEQEKWTHGSSRDAARALAKKAEVRQPVQQKAAGAERVVEEAIDERARARIRNAAREAWKNNPFMEEEAREQRAVRSQPAQGGMEMVSESPQRAQTPPPPQDNEIVTLKNEINRLQKMIEGFQKVPQTFVTMHPGADYGIPYDLSFMFQKLTESGITIENTAEILQAAAKEIDPVQIKKRPIVDAWVARWILDHTHVTQTPTHGRVHIFVGGAGSGKTTALVKMASHLVVKEKKKVAILSTDSFKVGAVDQMKIYCQILNVPFAVLRNKKDWEWVLNQLQYVDHILVDFPGLQLRDLDEIHLLKSLLPPEGITPVGHFCISATSKDGDAYEIARRYKVADFADIIFTNLDQSVQHGIVYNLQKKTGKPLHSFGIGNRIPEDFEWASKERVLDLIFKLTKFKREIK